MNLSNIRYFIEAARCENFTEASENLYISQPSLSKHIANIEKEIGVELFSRSHRSVKLTPAGNHLYLQFKDLVVLFDNAVAKTQKIGKEDNTTISIGILEGQEFAKLIMNSINKFRTNYPSIDFKFARGSFSELRNGLGNGNYDLIITMSFELMKSKGFMQKVICSQQGAIAINKNNPKSLIPNLTLDMLSDEDFVSISPDESPTGYALMVRQCYSYGFKPRIVHKFSSSQDLLLSIEAGIGISIIDRNTRLEESSAVRMVTIEDGDCSHLSVCWLGSNANSMVSKLANDLCSSNISTI